MEKFQVNEHIREWGLFLIFQAATFEVLLVRMACLFDPTSSTMMFTNGKLFRRQTTGVRYGSVESHGKVHQATCEVL